MEDINKRTPNFSKQEEVCLITLVEKYKNIIECKKTDSDVNIKKKETWKTITDEFRCITGIARSEATLRNKYQNLKKRTKKKFADEKKITMGTGGGPSQVVIITDTDRALKDILGSQITGNVSEFDDDAVNEETKTETPSAIDPTVDVPRTIENMQIRDTSTIFTNVASTPATTKETIGNKGNSSSVALDSPNTVTGSAGEWANYTPVKLKRPVSKALKRFKGNLTNQVTAWAEEKADSAKLQKAASDAEHQQRQAHAQEIHEQRLRFAEEEHKVKLSYMQAEHELKIKILRGNVKEKRK